MSSSKISRMETGVSGLQADDVATLLGYYQVSATKRNELLELLRRGDQKGWWERQAGLPSVDNVVASRMGRQTVFTRSTAPQNLAVIHEVALRRSPACSWRKMRILPATGWRCGNILSVALAPDATAEMITTTVVELLGEERGHTCAGLEHSPLAQEQPQQRHEHVRGGRVRRPGCRPS